MRQTKIYLVLGGARSGKSNFALNLSRQIGKKIVYLATLEPRDKEMKERVKRHRLIRPCEIKTVEERINLAERLKKLSGYDTAIVDCITIWIFNQLQDGYGQKDMISSLNRLFKINKNLILVSNEVGMGIVPENKLAREFRDIQGRLNQFLASRANFVYLLISGIPFLLKSDTNKAFPYMSQFLKVEVENGHLGTGSRRKDKEVITGKK